MIWLLNFKGYSQTIVSNNNDTSICFNSNQAKFLLKAYYSKIELDSLNRRYLTIIQYKDSILENNNIQFEQLHRQILLQKEVISIQNGQITYLEDNLDKVNKSLIKNKAYFKVSAGLLLLLGTFVLIK
jgi:hypothetical protein